jgi:hypothetical protein
MTRRKSRAVDNQDQPVFMSSFKAAEKESRRSGVGDLRTRK